MKRILSVVLAVMVLLSAVMCVSQVAFAASGATLAYNYTGSEASQAGFAQGTFKLTANDSASAGKYYLYWADDTKALAGYREIATLSVTAGGSATYKMLENTVIPVGAKNVIAIKSSSEPADKTVANAGAVYAINKSKQTESKFLYSFGAISDPQLANDSYGSNSYPNDETHLARAFESLHNRGVDFIVSSGDTVNDQDGAKTYAAEYKTYQKILANSSYANPIYEANGNHDVQVVWNGSTGNNNSPFVRGTGLDSTLDTIKTGKPYYDITEPTTGDHFIFMALEGGFRTNENTQFSTAQLDWLEGLLKAYSKDGKNIFIIEHANVAGWGSGDKLTKPYYYDLALDPSRPDVARFIDLMEQYKDCIMITGHTHLELSARDGDTQYNYSDNNGTSAVMMHNSAIGGVRRLVNGVVDRDAVLGLSEGYVVDVYEDFVIFNGTNLYYNEIMPSSSYIIPMDTSALDPDAPTPTKPTVATTPTTATTATQPTQAGDITAGYYMVGELGGASYWDVETLSNSRKLIENPDSKGEYYLNYTFADGDQVKVVYFDGTAIKTWYKDNADNYHLTASGGKTGACTMYFNPNGRSDWTYTFFTVQKGTFTPVTPTQTQPTETQKPTQPTTPSETQKPTQPTTPSETQKPTQPTQVTEPSEPEIMYGDVDMDKKLTVLDATLIQRHLAHLITLNDDQITAAKVSGNANLSVLDATVIQRKLAHIIEVFPVENNKQVAVTSASDIATLIATAKADLSTYYTYSSYDQYMAVKKYVKELGTTGDTSQSAYDKLDALHKDFLAIVEGTGGIVGDTIDVYFTNTPNWSKVNVYVWNSSGNNGWPGEAMEYVETNEFSQKVYKITLETGKYDNIIFNNGSAQTVDLPLSNINNEGFYTTDQTNGKYNCATYIYGE